MPQGDSQIFVGRAEALGQLKTAVEHLRVGGGSFWLVSGPVGIGKTTLLERLGEEARQSGARVLQGQAVRDPPIPFLTFEELFRGEGAARALPEARPRSSPLLIIEGGNLGPIAPRLAAHALPGPLLLVTRDRKGPVGNLDRPGAPLKTLFLSRAEGPDHVSPANLDPLGQRLEEHLRSLANATVLLPDVEYLIVQNSFLAVLRLLQFLREIAESSGGRLVLSLNPRSLDSRERALLESEGEVLSEDNQTSPPVTSGELAPLPSGLQLLRFLGELEEIARSRPVVVILDDLQWAGSQTAMALQFLVRNSRSLPVLILGAMRTEYLEGSHAGEAAVNETLDRLAREGLLTRLPLPGLSPSERVDLAESLLGEKHAPVAEETATLIDLLEPTQGNPLWVRELVLYLSERGFLVRRGGTWIRSHPAPEARQPPVTLSLHRLVSQRLLKLSREERDVVEAGALVGPAFGLESICGGLGIPEPEGRRILTDLAESKHLLAPVANLRDRWRFAHPFLREKVLEELPPARSRALAARLAEWWVRTHPEEVDEVAGFYHTSGSAEPALQWVRKAAERAVRTHHGEAMARYSRWLLGWLSTSPQELPAHLDGALQLAEGLRAQAATLEAERLLRDLDRATLPAPLHWRVSLALADVLLDEHRVEEVEALLAGVRRQMEQEPGPAPPGLRAAFEILRADLEVRSGGSEKAATTVALGLELLGEGGDPRWRARGLELQGWISLRRDDLPAAARAFAEGVALCRRAGLAGFLPLHLEGSGQVEWRRGNLPGALRDFEEAGVSARAQGDLLGTCGHLLSLATTLSYAGRKAEAEAAALDALKISEQFDYLWSAGSALLFLGELELSRGRWGPAKEHLALAVNRFALLGDNRSREEAGLLLLRIRGEMGDPVGALRDLESSTLGGVRRLSVQSRLHELVGDIDRSLSDLDRAWEDSLALPVLERARLRLEAARLEAGRGHSERARQLGAEAQALVASSRTTPPQ